MRGPACGNECFVVNPNHRQTMSDEVIGPTFEPPTKGRELNCLGLQSSIGEQVFRFHILEKHISYRLAADRPDSPAPRDQLEINEPITAARRPLQSLVRRRPRAAARMQ